MFKVITIGDATVDNFVVIDHDSANLQCDLKKEHCQLCFNYADKIPIQSTAESVGGNAANVAVGVKKLGLQSAIVSEIGDDLNGAIINDSLKRAGVDVSLLKILRGSETRFSVVLHYQSERTILSYHVKRQYSLPKLPATDWIYYTSLGESFEDLQEQLVEHFKKHPTISLALNLGSFQIQNNLKKIQEILPLVDLLFVNKEEAEKLVGKKRTPQATLNALLEAGVKKVVVTDGENGSWAGDEETIYFMPIYPLPPIAKTGAGDAYASGFLSAIILGKHLDEAMQWGTANACGVVQHVGSQKGLLNRTEIEKMIAKYPKVKPREI